MSIFDVIAVGLIFGFGIWGHFVGLVPEAINIISLVISSCLAVVFGSILGYFLIPIFGMPVIMLSVSVIFVLVVLDKTWKVIFIPKNLANELYIDVPFYYITGAVLGSIRGYLFSLLLFFLVSFTNIYSDQIRANTNLDMFFAYSNSLFSLFIPNAVEARLRSIFDNNLKLDLKDENILEKSVAQNNPNIEIINQNLVIINAIPDVSVKDSDVLFSMMSKMEADTLTKLYKRISFLDKRKMITKDVVFGLIVREFALAVKSKGIEVSDEEGKFLNSFAVNNLLNETQDRIVYNYAKKLPPPQNIAPKPDVTSVTNVPPVSSANDDAKNPISSNAGSVNSQSKEDEDKSSVASEKKLKRKKKSKTSED